MTQDNTDAAFFRRLGASRLLRTVCAAPTGAANMGLYGKMPSVTYLDYPHARLIVMWGMNPSASGIHAIPFIKEAQKAGAKLVVIDPRVTPLARTADLHLAVRPGTDLVVALALHRVLFEEGHADHAFLDAHATGVDALRARAAEWTIERAAEVSGLDPARPAHVRRPVRADQPGAGPLRLGRRAQSQRRQRRRGHPGLAGRRAASSASAAAAMR